MASLQQLVEQLALLAAQGNATTGPHATFTSATAPINLVSTIFKIFFSASALRDWAVLLVIGSLFETARRLLRSTWYTLIDAFFITAVFDEDDASFRTSLGSPITLFARVHNCLTEWIMFWLTKQPSWSASCSPRYPGRVADPTCRGSTQRTD